MTLGAASSGMDPNQRKVLEVSYEALEIAGFNMSSLQRISSVCKGRVFANVLRKYKLVVEQIRIWEQFCTAGRSPAHIAAMVGVSGSEWVSLRKSLLDRLCDTLQLNCSASVGLNVAVAACRFSSGRTKKSGLQVRKVSQKKHTTKAEPNR
eukprot:2114185-Amphidinium_carterae.1